MVLPEMMGFPLITDNHPLILASDSPRRKKLLEQLGIPFLCLPSGLDESRVMGSGLKSPSSLAKEKAKAVRGKIGDGWILGADTIVVLGGVCLGKPHDREEARSMLQRLRGKVHRVVTGFCLINPSGDLAHSQDVTTVVKMKSVTDDEIEGYIATGEPFGKAGSYAIQGIGAFMVEAIFGSYTNVVGLPLCPLVEALLSTGALKRFPTSSATTSNPSSV